MTGFIFSLQHPLYQINIPSYDHLHLCFRLCDWLSLRCLVTWINTWPLHVLKLLQVYSKRPLVCQLYIVENSSLCHVQIFIIVTPSRAYHSLPYSKHTMIPGTFTVVQLNVCPTFINLCREVFYERHRLLLDCFLLALTQYAEVKRCAQMWMDTRESESIEWMIESLSD